MLRHSLLCVIAPCVLLLVLAEDICSSDKKKGELVYSSPKRCITESTIWVFNYTKEVEEDHGLKTKICPLSKDEEEKGWNVRIVHLDEQAVIDAVFSKAKERISKTNRRWLIGAKNRKKILQFECPVNEHIKTEEMRSYYEYEDGTKVRDDLWCKNEPLDNCPHSNSEAYYSMAIIYEGQSCLDDFGIEGLRAFALCDYYIDQKTQRQPTGGISKKIIETLYKEKANFRYFDFIIEEDYQLTKETVQELPSPCPNVAVNVKVGQEIHWDGEFDWGSATVNFGSANTNDTQILLHIQLREKDNHGRAIVVNQQSASSPMSWVNQGFDYSKETGSGSILPPFKPHEKFNIIIAPNAKGGVDIYSKGKLALTRDNVQFDKFNCYHAYDGINATVTVHDSKTKALIRPGTSTNGGRIIESIPLPSPSPCPKEAVNVRLGQEIRFDGVFDSGAVGIKFGAATKADSKVLLRLTLQERGPAIVANQHYKYYPGAWATGGDYDNSKQTVSTNVEPFKKKEHFTVYIVPNARGGIDVYKNEKLALTRDNVEFEKFNCYMVKGALNPISITVQDSTHKSSIGSGIALSATATDVRRKHHTVIVINEENTDESSTGVDTYAVGIGAHPAIAKHLEELTYIPSNRRFKIPNIEAENKELCPSLQRLVFESTENIAAGPGHQVTPKISVDPPIMEKPEFVGTILSK